MAIYIELLACKFISEAARKELERAACPVHKEVPGLDRDIEIVELQHSGWESRDRSGMSVWDVPREIQIVSRGLYLNYAWNDEVNGGALTLLEEEMRQAVYKEHNVETNDYLGDLDEHPF